MLQHNDIYCREGNLVDGGKSYCFDDGDDIRFTQEESRKTGINVECLFGSLFGATVVVSTLHK